MKPSLRDVPPPLPDGFQPAGWTRDWQVTVNRVSWYLQRRLGLDKKYQAHNFTTILTLVIQVITISLLSVTPYTSGLIHWLLLALCIPFLPVGIFLLITTFGVSYEKE